MLASRQVRGAVVAMGDSITDGVGSPVDATARSQVATSWQPAAVAMPAISAITGCGICWIVCISVTQTSKVRR